MSENKAHCRRCRKQVTRMRDTSPTADTKRPFMDETGKKWIGYMCPKCVSGKSKYEMRSATREKLRPCQNCGAMSKNYFNCPTCLRHHGSACEQANVIADYGVVW